MARTKSSVQEPKDGATARPRGRPAKDATSADTGAGVKKAVAKVVGKARGRPKGSTNKETKPKEVKAKSAGRGRPPGGGIKKAKPIVAPAVPPTESTTGADRRRAKLGNAKLESLPQVKKRDTTKKTIDRRRSKVAEAKSPVSDAGEPEKDVDLGTADVGDGNLKTSSKGNARASGNARGGGGEQPMFSSLKGLFG